VRYSDAEIEANSGKDAGDENFPVGSLLIAPALRPHVAAYYAFARAADDIADHAELSADEKVRRLDAFESVLRGEAEGLSKPQRLRESLQETGVDLERARLLLDAFRQDARKTRYASIDELLAYCARSADPVGRFLLDLHGEDPELYPASDGLCTALQILNHLQDMGEDWRALDRCYLPLQRLADLGDEVEAVERDAVSPALRAVMDELLDLCAQLIDRADALATQLHSARLAAESAVIINLARRLERRLRAGDPLAGRIALSKADFAAAGAGGLWRVLVRPAPTRKARAA
jgi:squalene synthase HpnC